MLKITDKPKYEDYDNTVEVMDMFRHVVHSDFVLEWISGALAHLETQRTKNKALTSAIEIWFNGKDEERKEFEKLLNKVETLTFKFDLLKLIEEKVSDFDD